MYLSKWLPNGIGAMFEIDVYKRSITLFRDSNGSRAVRPDAHWNATRLRDEDGNVSNVLQRVRAGDRWQEYDKDRRCV